MPNVLIYYNESAHTAALRAVAQGEDLLTQLLARYQALNLSAALTTADLSALVAQPAETLFDKYVAGSSFSFGGLPLNRAKALELLEVPVTFQQVVEFAKTISGQLKGFANDGAFLATAASSYEISGNLVRFTGAARQQLEANYKRYATTDKQVALLAELTTIADAINRLRAKEASGYSSAAAFLGFALEDGWPGNSVSGTVRPNPDFVLKGTR